MMRRWKFTFRREDLLLTFYSHTGGTFFLSRNFFPFRFSSLSGIRVGLPDFWILEGSVVKNAELKEVLWEKSWTNFSANLFTLYLFLTIVFLEKSCFWREIQILLEIYFAAMNFKNVKGRTTGGQSIHFL